MSSQSEVVEDRRPSFELSQHVVPGIRWQCQYRPMNTLIKQICQPARVCRGTEHADVDLGSVTAMAIARLVEERELACKRGAGADRQPTVAPLGHVTEQPGPRPSADVYPWT